MVEDMEVILVIWIAMCIYPIWWMRNLRLSVIRVNPSLWPTPRRGRMLRIALATPVLLIGLPIVTVTLLAGSSLRRLLAEKLIVRDGLTAKEVDGLEKVLEDV